jgi:putative DNA primase/helicase
MNPNLNPPDGVTLDTWLRLAKQDGDRWAIDERKATGDVIGTAYRNSDGSKTFKPGGKRGLILVWPMSPNAGIDPSEPVFICEGASDTAALMGLNLYAIGIPMAGHCADELANLVEGLNVVLVTDADDAGRRGTAKLSAALAARCESVRVIEPPGGFKDSRAAVIAGATRKSFLDIAKDAAKVAATPKPVDGAPVLVCMADVDPREVSWLWEGRIPRGRLTLLVGRPGEGKSMASMDWAARVSTGRAWPDGSPCPVGSVVLVAAEDDPHDTIRPRLDAHDADASKVHLLKAVIRLGSGGTTSEVAFTLADLTALEATLAQVPDCVLVIVDPVGSFIGGTVDANSDNKVRAVLAPLAALAERTGAAVLIVAHQRKGAAAHADDLVIGSRAFTGIARSVLHLLIDPNDDKRRLLLPGKMNLAAPAAGLAFIVGGTPPRIEWEPDPVAMTADDVMAAQAGMDRGGRTERDDAAEWLRDILAHGPRSAADVLAESKAAGYSKTTINRAKKIAGVLTRKGGFDGGWVWELREDRHEGRQSCDSGNLGTNPGETCEKHPKDATTDRVAPLDGESGNLAGDGGEDA